MEQKTTMALAAPSLVDVAERLRWPFDPKALAKAQRLPISARAADLERETALTARKILIEVTPLDTSVARGRRPQAVELHVEHVFYFELSDHALDGARRVNKNTTDVRTPEHNPSKFELL